MAPVLRAAYSDRTAALMAWFSQIAYVPYLDHQPAPGATAPKQQKPQGVALLDASLASGGLRLVKTFNKGNVQAFLAVLDGAFAVLAFRGTATMADWGIDLNIGRVTFAACPGVHVHRGFLAAYEVSQIDIFEAVSAYVPDELPFYITGHSLGGALAQIASALLARDNLAACYTYGSPRVATKSFDAYVKCPHYRVINHWDIVPGVPLATPWGYQHGGDPRLLRGLRPKAIIRQDHSPGIRVLVDIITLLRGLVAHKFLVVDDHMIWNYRTQLDVIAQARAHR